MPARDLLDWSNVCLSDCGGSAGDEAELQEYSYQGWGFWSCIRQALNRAALNIFHAAPLRCVEKHVVVSGVFLWLPFLIYLKPVRRDDKGRDKTDNRFQEALVLGFASVEEHIRLGWNENFDCVSLSQMKKAAKKEQHQLSWDKGPY